MMRGRRAAADSWITAITHENATKAARRPSLSLNGLATDLDTEHGGTDANKRDGATQVGRLNPAGLQL
jgi:hypothetical protein